jgi:membrane associated rhomboid family serine protease
MLLAVQDFIERRPGVGIFASVSGLLTSLTSLIQAVSIFIGLGGAIFGLLAGYYTFRIQRKKWLKEQNNKQ